MVANIENSISTKELCREYDWFHSTFASVLQGAFDDFFNKNFIVKFFGLSKNINCLIDKEKCFVTKVQIDKEYEIFIRLTDKVIDIVLNKVLGQSKTSFSINKITAIEAKVITSFNRTLYEKISPLLSPPNPKEIKRTNFNMINLTFVLKDTDEEAKEAGRVIVTIPEALLTPDKIEYGQDIVSETDFPFSETMASIIVGSTRFSMYDVKHLEKGDVVVFEDSSIDRLKINIQGEIFEVNINPNMSILIPEDNNEGEESMSKTHNIWDSIEVDMNAEFDAVKISLGDLKSIEQGLVVDLASLYDNNVTLKVEGKVIANGNLVIVNDRYGVKINEIIAKKDKLTAGASSANSDENLEENEEGEYSEEENEEYSEEEENEENEYSEEEENSEENEDEEFDYSDFELEDENI